MTFKVTLISLNFERYKSPSRMTKFSSLQENSITNILVLNLPVQYITDHVI